MKKRLISLLLTLSMVFGMVPMLGIGVLGVNHEAVNDSACYLIPYAYDAMQYSNAHYYIAHHNINSTYNATSLETSFDNGMVSGILNSLKDAKWYEKTARVVCELAEVVFNSEDGSKITERDLYDSLLIGMLLDNACTSAEDKNIVANCVDIFKNFFDLTMTVGITSINLWDAISKYGASIIDTIIEGFAYGGETVKILVTDESNEVVEYVFQKTDVDEVLSEVIGTKASTLSASEINKRIGIFRKIIDYFVRADAHRREVQEKLAYAEAIRASVGSEILKLLEQMQDHALHDELLQGKVSGALSESIDRYKALIESEDGEKAIQNFIFEVIVQEGSEFAFEVMCSLFSEFVLEKNVYYAALKFIYQWANFFGNNTEEINMIHVIGFIHNFNECVIKATHDIEEYCVAHTSDPTSVDACVSYNAGMIAAYRLQIKELDYAVMYLSVFYGSDKYNEYFKNDQAWENEMNSIDEIKKQLIGKIENYIAAPLSIYETHILYITKGLTVKYNLNGGIGNIPDQIKPYNSIIRLSNVIPRKEGHIFKGWNIEGQIYASREQLGPNLKETREGLEPCWCSQEITATAQYTDVDAITYIADEATNVPASHENKGVLSNQVPKKTGYTFLGWDEKPDVKTPTYKAGDPITKSGDITLYAIWEYRGGDTPEVTTYTITYDYNNGSGTTVTQEKPAGEDVFLTVSPPNYNGHIFLGWALDDDSETVEYRIGAIYSEDADLDLYAVWAEKVGGEEEETEWYIVDEGWCSDTVEWSLDSYGVLCIEGSGPIPDYNARSNESAPWEKYSSQIKELEIGRGITSIYTNAFNGYGNLESVYLPTSITRLEYQSFANCTSLTTLTLPAGMNYKAFYNGNIGAFQGDKAICDITIIGEGKLYGYTNGIGTYTPWHVGSAAGNDVTVKISEGVTTINRDSFSGCANLVSVRIPSTVTTIESNAFNGCTRLTTTGDEKYAVPETVISVGENAFKNCSSLTGSLPSSFEKIGAYAFYGCSSLTGEIIVNEAITDIREYTFYGCSGITGISLPTTLTDIGHKSFADCTSLTTLILPAGMDYSAYNSGNYGAFQGDKAICDITIIGEGKLYGYTNGIGTYTPWHVGSAAGNDVTVKISEGVTTINRDSFSGCANLVSVRIPSTVTTIESNAFNGCTRLMTTGDENYAVPETVVSVGENAFKNCSSLTGTLPSSFEMIGKSAFYGCSSLTGEIAINEAITSIYEYTFYGCSGITSISLPRALTKIGHQSFANCTSLTTLTLPAGMDYSANTSGNYGAFQGDKAICDITIIGEGKLYGYTNGIGTYTPWHVGSAAGNEVTVKIGEGVTTINRDSFSGCANLVSVRIPSTVTTIESNAFNGCTRLMTTGDENYAVPETVVSVGENAFKNCSSLTGTLPSSFEMIGKSAFYGCSSLTGEIIVNEAITDIREYTFYGCSGITGISLPTTLTDIGHKSFADCTSLTTLILPAGMDYSAYNSGNYGAFQGDKAICDITIIGEGKLYGYTNGIGTYTPWHVGSAAGNDVTVTICEGVTNINRETFSGCENLVSVSIPGTVTTIENDAFNGCTGLTDVWYGSTMEKWNSISIGSGNTVLSSVSVTIHTFTIDVDGDGSTTEADALYLLRHTILPVRYPLSADNADFDGNGIVDAKDAVYLKQRIG